MAVKQRITKRKAAIEKVLAEEYASGPVLLEELRWKVLTRQYGPSFVEMTNANQKSFARTIREHSPKYTINKVPIDSDVPLGLVARAAVYRLRRLNELNRFVHGEAPCILCRYQTKLDINEPRYYSWNRYVTPHYHAATFRFFPKRPAALSYEEIQLVPGTFIPATQKLSLVAAPGINADPQSAAVVPWKLFGYEKLNDWFDVCATHGLWAVERNRR